MFNLIDIGERAKSGIPNIFRVWREQGWAAPVIKQLAPERILLALSCGKTGDKKSVISARMKETIITYLAGHTQAKASSIAGHIGAEALPHKGLSERADRGRDRCRAGQQPEQDLSIKSLIAYS